MSEYSVFQIVLICTQIATIIFQLWVVSRVLKIGRSIRDAIDHGKYDTGEEIVIDEIDLDSEEDDGPYAEAVKRAFKTGNTVIGETDESGNVVLTEVEKKE